MIVFVSFSRWDLMMSSSSYTLRYRHKISGEREIFCSFYPFLHRIRRNCNKDIGMRQFSARTSFSNSRTTLMKKWLISTVGWQAPPLDSDRVAIWVNWTERSRGGRQVTDRKSDDELFYLFLFSFTRRPHSFIRPDHPCNTLVQAEVGAEFSLGPHGTSLILSFR